MPFVLYLLLATMLALHQAQGFASLEGQIQPGIYPPPALPHNFTKKPEYWRSPNAARAHAVAPSYHGTSFSSQFGKVHRKIISSRQSTTAWPGWSNIRYIFAFGDSYTSTGFNANGAQPNPNNPLGNPAYPGATSANGPNYVDFLTTTYNQTYIQTYNFGYGGATIDPALDPSPYGLIVQSFEQQVVQSFLPLYSHGAVPWTADKTLFTVFFGINDVIVSYHNSSLDYDLIKDYESLVNRLYAAGARNFVFMNVPPVDRTPGGSVLSSVDRESLASYIGEFNFRLELLVYYLGLRHPDTTNVYFDTNWLFTRVIADPDQFRETSMYRNTTNYCTAYSRGTPTLTYLDPACRIPVDEYLWLNDLHPTYPMHNLMASQVVQQFTGWYFSHVL